MKSLRQQKIIEIITSRRVDTQEMLRELLLDENISVTQATLSRDIKELRLKKITDKDGNTGYAADDRVFPQFPQLFCDSVVSVDYAVNTVVFKCHTGMAQAACAVFDRLECHGVVGTLAGDDTFFVLMRTPDDAAVLTEETRKFLENSDAENAGTP